MANFSFNFSSEDIEGDESDAELVTKLDGHHAGDDTDSHDLIPVKHHGLGDMLSTLPSSISYSMHTISTDPLIRLPRRELFDIRAQLLAETDTADVVSTALAEGLSSDDIQPRLYEGGFKTWECSLDLARLLGAEMLQGQGDDGRIDVVEIGAGTAVPSSVILDALLRHHPPGISVTVPKEQRRALVVADYNEHVLTHASIPNLLLTYVHAKHSMGHTTEDFEEQGELDITEVLLHDFHTWLEHVGLIITGISGAWSSEFSRLLNVTLHQERRLVLASETIYQPESLSAFTAVLLKLLRNKKSTTTDDVGLVAAKKIYFGVGGGVDEFLSVLHAAGGNASPAWSSGIDGVNRVILRIKP